MKTRNGKVLTYQLNTTLMAEIKTLEQKLQARLTASKMTKLQFAEYMQILSAGYSGHKRLKYENSNFDDLNLRQMFKVLIRKQYALEHGKNVSRGKAYAKQRRELQNLNTVGA